MDCKKWVRAWAYLFLPLLASNYYLGVSVLIFDLILPAFWCFWLSIIPYLYVALKYCLRVANYGHDFLSLSIEIASGTVYIRPPSSQVATILNGLSQILSPFKSKISLNLAIICEANCSCLRSSPLFTMQLINPKLFLFVSPPYLLVSAIFWQTS